MIKFNKLLTKLKDIKVYYNNIKPIISSTDYYGNFGNDKNELNMLYNVLDISKISHLVNNIRLTNMGYFLCDITVLNTDYGIILNNFLKNDYLIEFKPSIDYENVLRHIHGFVNINIKEKRIEKLRKIFNE